MEDVYVYQPLPTTGWIRLMIIDIAANVDDPISCTLKDHAADDDLSFEALSYTWGDEPAQIPILLGGKRFLCRKNLESALRALRRSDSQLLLWVDAICINQADEAERNSQVVQMREVYCKAERVNVWLGDASGGSDCGMELLADFSKIVRSDSVIKVGSTWDNEGVRIQGATSTLSQAGFFVQYKPVFAMLDVLPRAKDLDDVVDLLRRSWWTRMWTLQESVLGRRVDVYCGSKTVPLAFFSTFPWRGSHIGAGVALREVWRMADLRDHIRGQGRISLLLALDSSWNRTASDPKDKVIGLLGLLGDHNDMKPDYAWSIDKVYRAAFKALVIETKDLGFLGLISEERSLRNSSLPSWVPDLELHSKPGSDYISSLSKPIFNPTLYNAFHGRVIDNITTLGEKAPRRIVYDDEPSSRAYWRCIMADLKQGPLHKGYDSGKPTRLDESDLRTLSELSSESGRRRLLFYWAGFCRRGSQQLRLIEQFNRRFFVTKAGYIGLGPEWLESGDAICILETGRVAYALRQVNNENWTYVGECYVHGLMDAPFHAPKHVSHCLEYHLPRCY
ncbi:HET-domain-containing protein [Hyaloscypha variabilis F]|uniref:HET-domain-containing protein n=1 Tax=Hyaloscypha variabilis (strain UAMH 11265 / GT02V1 / F) TaxID=1149755 RepID=A0A2J6QXA7_HYAVF|nr:HET-domain-containing protein [Hyaloscypha variabilis F]